MHGLWKFQVIWTKFAEIKENEVPKVNNKKLGRCSHTLGILRDFLKSSFASNCFTSKSYALENLTEGFHALLTPVIKELYTVINDCNGTRTHNHLVRKRTLNHLAKLTRWLSWIVSTYLYGAFKYKYVLLGANVEANLDRGTKNP